MGRSSTRSLSVDAHAECTPTSQGANTYVHTAPNSVTVLGTNVGAGKTTVPVTGAQLGVAGVDHGSLDVSYTTTATQAQQASTTSAHAHMDLSISGVFYDSAGKQLYSGPAAEAAPRRCADDMSERGGDYAGAYA